MTLFADNFAYIGTLGHQLHLLVFRTNYSWALMASYFAVIPSKAAQFLFSSRIITSQSSRPIAFPDRMSVEITSPCFLASSPIFLRIGRRSRM